MRSNREPTDTSWKGWYYSGSAPHRDDPHCIQFITFRLADSIPQHLLRELARESKTLPESERGSYQRRNIELWLDSGLGCCALRNQKMAAALEDALKYHHGQRYRLIAWCIMPNHVHVLIDTWYSLPKIVQTWKSVTTRWMFLNNDRLRLRVPTRSLWMRDYWDRFVRDEHHFRTAVEYIHQNPVKAGLCRTAAEWKWSSAYSEGSWGDQSMA
ncbi:transposase [Pseudomonas sp. gcc21]|uniref:REP-associated tyrosine transposase n=1 Tax=Pseudomonas sp. gcc21 TaxID=2726989 RepID=UPI0014516C29|nr:transposase [Pseudomonas sp. gcc21]QJD58690.1 transposase [Pseudomonas sp. gcc21]